LRGIAFGAAVHPVPLFKALLGLDTLSSLRGGVALSPLPAFVATEGEHGATRGGIKDITSSPAPFPPPLFPALG